MIDSEDWDREGKIGENFKDKLNERGYVPLSPMERKSKEDLREEIPDEYNIVDWDVEKNPIRSQAMFKKDAGKVYFLDSSGSYIGRAEKDL